jgi:hypothetical protein
VHEPNPAHGYSARFGGLPRAAGRKAGWATARWPGPAGEAARVPRGCALTVCVGRVVTARSPCAVACSPSTRWQGVAGELMGTTGRAPGKEGGWRGSPRWWCDDGAERWLGATARWGPHRREGRRLALGAAGEDERGEGGPE